MDKYDDAKRLMEKACAGIIEVNAMEIALMDLKKRFEEIHNKLYPCKFTGSVSEQDFDSLMGKLRHMKYEYTFTLRSELSTIIGY